MKVTEIKIRHVLDAFFHHWKAMALCILSFAILGAVAGFLYAERGAAPAAGSAQQLELLDLEEVERDTGYYQSCRSVLLERYELLKKYISALEGQSGLNQEFAEELEQEREALTDFYQLVYQEIADTLNDIEGVFVPVEFLSEKEAEYEQLLLREQYSLIAEQAAAEMIKEMTPPEMTYESVNKAYLKLLEQAAAYPETKQQIAQYERMLDKIDNEKSVIIAGSKMLERQIEHAADDLNGFTQRVNAMAQEIAQGQYWNVVVEEDAEKGVEIEVKHTHAASSAQESFAIMMVFCLLCGVCVGGFLAICLEAKKQWNVVREKNSATE